MIAGVDVGDCVELMAAMGEASVDAVVCDPPYGLEFMGKDWDRFVPEPRRLKEWDGRRRDDGADRWEQSVRDRGDGRPGGPGYSVAAHYKPNTRCRLCGLWQFDKNPCRCETPDWEYRVREEAPTQRLGYQSWCEAWAREALRVLKPGGHLLAFGGTRTSHRLACAVEDAGFEIRDTIAWMYGSGFPKSLDVSKAIDRRRHDGADKLRVTSWLADAAERNGVSRADVDAHMGTSDMGGWWLSKLPHRCAIPTLEQVPALLEALRLEIADVPDAIRELLIDLNGMKGQPGEAWFRREVIGERDVPVGHAFAGPTYGGDSSAQLVDVTTPATDDARRWNGWGTALKPAHEPIVVARKPLAGTVAANVLEHGTGALNVDGCRIGTEPEDDARRARRSTTALGLMNDDGWEPTATATGGHEQGRWPANVVLDEEAAATLDEQSGEGVSRVGKPRASQAPGDGWGMTSTGAEYDDRGGASRFFYTAKASRAERNAGLDGFEEGEAGRTNAGRDGRRSGLSARQNVHPTVKPISLMRWLVRLVTPPDGLILDPFTGSGTTGIAAGLEGLRFHGLERDTEYAAIAEARIRWWAQHGEQALEIVARAERAEQERASVADAGQLDIFSEDAA